jgi:hypothetical protein
MAAHKYYYRIKIMGTIYRGWRSSLVLPKRATDLPPAVLSFSQPPSVHGQRESAPTRTSRRAPSLSASISRGEAPGKTRFVRRVAKRADRESSANPRITLRVKHCAVADTFSIVFQT